MNVLTSRIAHVAVAVVIQLALVPVAVAGPLSARVTGDEYHLEVAPVDPIDPFRGAYVALTYPGLPNDPDDNRGRERGATVYVPLVRHGDVWVGTAAVAERPTTGPFLRCKDDWQLKCGIESWFLPQGKALALERAVNQRPAVARIRIDSRGNAALVDVELRDDE